MRILIPSTVVLSLAFHTSFAQSPAKLPPAATVNVDYEKHVLPILSQKCYSCHAGDVQQSGLRLDLRQNALRGGDYGPVIVAGKSAESKLIRRLVNGDGGLQMPPTGALSDDEIGILRAWIDQGPEFRTDIKEATAKPVDPKLAVLITAVRSADAGEVKKRLVKNQDLISAQDTAGSTLLHHAAGFGSVDTMKLLLSLGADASAKNKRKSTPLFWAIHDPAKVKLLLDAGVDVNDRNVDGRTALYQAVSLGNPNGLVKMLLDRGANVNLATTNGATVLMMAATRGNVGAMRMLIEKQADVNAKNGAGGTALMNAAASGNPAAVRLLLDNGADSKAATKRNETALANAATTGNLEMVKMLLAAGAPVNTQDVRGYSPLLYAAGSDTAPIAVVKLLLENGADTSCLGDEETAKALAAKRGNTEVAKLLGTVEEQKTAAAMPTKRPIPEAVEKAFGLLAKQSHTFIRTAGCNSCHAQDLPSAAAAIARDRGLPAPKEIAQLPTSMIMTPERGMDLGFVQVGSIGWELFDLGMNHSPKDHYTDAAVRFLKAMQTADGSWHAPEGRRPPVNVGPFNAAALAVYAMNTYSPDTEKVDTQRAIARAAKWFEGATSKTSQDRAFHLLGLAWAKGSAAKLDSVAKELAASQRADGGWSQLAEQSSDAYATGQALYALAVSGKASTTDPVFKKGIAFLRNTQAEDGSWHVKTRSIWVQPYFDSGFPYGHDQWISAAGTAWATMALSMSVEDRKISQR